MSTLDDVIDHIRTATVDRDLWLYIKGDADDLHLHTSAELGVPEFDDTSGEEIGPRAYMEQGLHETIDAETLEDCIKWADKLSGAADNRAAVGVIRYYIRFDAWPDRLDAPDPPPAVETNLQFYREFMDLLGPERADVQCRREGCERGAIELSVFCRPHHFESVQRVPYPFDD